MRSLRPHFSSRASARASALGLTLSLALFSANFATAQNSPAKDAQHDPAQRPALERPDFVTLDTTKLPRIEAPKRVIHGQKPQRVRVLVYEFNPWVPGSAHSPQQPDAPRKRLSVACGWKDPLALARGYMQDLCDASGGYVQYEIVSWHVVDQFQLKMDGFRYTPETYMQCRRGERKWHHPDGADYARSLRELRIAERIDAGEADEVWWFGAPYMGWFESRMIGPGAFWVNGPAMQDFPCKRPFVVMGFSYERGVAEMLHDLGHRTESTMSRFYGGWKVDELTSNWARFAANEHQSGKGNAAVGTCHYPANGQKDYDYANPRKVLSTADDWLNYPKLTGKQSLVSRESWGGPDHHRNYQRWFFERLPKAPGVNPDGRENNWWKYIFDFASYRKDGQLRKAARREDAPKPQKRRTWI
jgi:hypothetical protein